MTHLKPRPSRSSQGALPLRGLIFGGAALLLPALLPALAQAAPPGGTVPKATLPKTAKIAGAKMAGAGIAGPQVTGIRVARIAAGPNGGLVEVTVAGARLARPAATLSPDGRAYTLDFDAPLAGKPMVAQTGFPSVPKVGVAWLSHKPARIRVALAVGSGSRPTLLPAGAGGWKVKIGPAPKPIVLAPSLSASARLPQAPARRVRDFGAFAIPTASPMAPLLTPPPVPILGNPILGSEAAPLLSPVAAAIPAVGAKRRVPPVFTPGGKPAVATKRTPRVSFDFTSTRPSQILRTLAMQTGSNIVSSADVQEAKPVSVSLHDVTTEEALNLVCTAANLRYAYRDGTYVVTTKAGYQEAQRTIAGSHDEPMLTRVVPIYSNEGQQVKAAVLKATGGDNARGRFELFLPSEDLSYKQTQDVTPEGKAGGKDGKGDTAELSVSSGTKGAKDAYIVVVGTAARLDEVAQLTTLIDGQICAALGRTMPSSPASFTKVYDLRGARAADLVTAIAGPGATRVGGVEILATPPGSISRQAIVLRGREDEVARVYDALSQLDSGESASTDYVTVDLSFSDPRAMREMLLSNVPGLAVTIPPASVGNPRLYTKDDTRKQSEERGTQLPAPQGGGSPLASGNGGNADGGNGASGSTQKDLTVGGDAGALAGLQQPYRDFEAIAQPMRLVLRGTPDQIARGTGLIRALDVAPKHVSIELRVMELNRDEALRAGLDINLNSGGAVKFVKLGNAQNDFQDTRNTIGLSLGSKSTPLDVTATLDRIANRNNLISRPNTVALDGRETELFVGDVIRYIKSIISTQNGVTVTTDEVRVGVRMAVLPRVGGDGNITMDLRPVVSFLRGFDVVAQIGGRLPQTSERVAQSSFNMKSGETIAISGLITDQDRRLVQGLPVLMDLPLVGQLFRKTTNERVRSELVIFVTARTIEGPLGGDRPTLPAQSELPGGPANPGAKGFPGPNAKDVKSKNDKGNGRGN